MMCCEFRLLKVARVLTLLIAGLSEEVLSIVVMALELGHWMSGSEIAWLFDVDERCLVQHLPPRMPRSHDVGVC